MEESGWSSPLERRVVQVRGVTFRCQTMHAEALFCAQNHHTDMTTKPCRFTSNITLERVSPLNDCGD